MRGYVPGGHGSEVAVGSEVTVKKHLASVDNGNDNVNLLIKRVESIE